MFKYLAAQDDIERIAWNREGINVASGIMDGVILFGNYECIKTKINSRDRSFGKGGC